MKAGLKLLSLFSVFLFTNKMAIAQSESGKVLTYSDSLIQIIQRSPSDSERKDANRVFDQLIYDALQKPSSFTAAFDSLSNLSSLTSPDNKIRILTWLLPGSNNNSYTYFGYLLFKDKNGKIKTYPLSDSTSAISNYESEKLKTERWYGALYYAIVPVKRTGKYYYTLLGWKAIDRQRTQKLIEILYFDNDIPKFGFPLLKSGKVFNNRKVFTFKSELSMVLRYEERKKLIVFDHLSNPGGNAMSSPGGPDGSYDAYRFKGGRWILQQDVDIRSDWKPKKNVPKPFGE